MKAPEEGDILFYLAIAIGIALLFTEGDTIGPREYHLQAEWNS
jgi:hypothetical protein